MSVLQYVLIGLCVILLVYMMRVIYQRSLRFRNRLQMEEVFTNISHELLTPLTVISASVEKLKEDEPRFSKDYALINMNIDRMVHLLQEILETSKSLSGELKLRVAHGDVMQYISRTALCLKPLMDKRRIKFTIKCTPQSMLGWIDTDKLDKIIYNLLSNAAKYTREGGNVALQVVTNDKFDSITITVTDNGIGISAKKMKKLFQRFNDGDYRKMHTIGTGLGMALTHDLVSLHGGSIDCESEEDKGTTFTVTLPISKKAFASAQIDNSQEIDFNQPQHFILDFEELAPEAETEKPMPVSESADEDVYRILVVEDNVELLMLMQTLLSRKYLVTTALNGAAAFDIVQNTDLDLIISDVMMPEMDGNELTKKLKNDPNTSRLPIILLTAKTQEKDRAESMIIGADDYITKPFKMSDLELRINNIIENRKRIRREFKAQTVEESRMKAEMPSPSANELFLQKAINCVYDHLADSDFDREAFAAEMGSSASSLYNKLRSITGLNVSAFIRDIRMKEAKRLAQTQPDIRVSDLAYRVGFKDPKYFSTCFKKDFGLQPSEYIEQMAGQ